MQNKKVISGQAFPRKPTHSLTLLEKKNMRQERTEALGQGAVSHATAGHGSK
jgi:hypothetical protein